MSYSSVVLGDAPVAYWRLQETSGTTTKDELGNYPGTYNGSVTLGQTQTGVSGDTSDLFDGASGYVSTSSLPSMPSVSVEVWFYPTTASQTANSCLVTDSYTGNGDINYCLYFPSSNLTLNCSVLGAGGWPGVNVILTSNTWNYVVMTFDGSTITAYLNGTPQGTASYSGAALTSSGYQSYIAKNWNSNQFVKGYIQEVAIYNKALTATQVQNHYNAATSGGTTPTEIDASATGSATGASSASATLILYATATGEATGTSLATTAGEVDASASGETTGDSSATGTVIVYATATGSASGGAVANAIVEVYGSAVGESSGSSSAMPHMTLYASAEGSSVGDSIATALLVLFAEAIGEATGEGLVNNFATIMSAVKILGSFGVKQSVQGSFQVKHSVKGEV